MIPLILWEPHCWPSEIQSELNRRTTNRSFKPIDNETSNWIDNDDSWNSYRGPMTSWLRVCSNGAGRESYKINTPMVSLPGMMPLIIPSYEKQGFVLYGGKDFYRGYGFNEVVGSNPNLTVIGYTPDGIPHTLENDIVSSDYPIHVPPPEVEKITAVIQRQILRQVRIEWVCFSKAQLEYMTPYFLVPGITIIVEWGWNHFNPLSLIDLKDTEQLIKYYNNPYPLYTENILNSKGNYEVVFALINNFEWSIDGNKIRCVTEATSKDRLYAGQIVKSNLIEQDLSSGKKEENEERVIDSLKSFVENYIDAFAGFIDYGNLTADEVVNAIIKKNEYNTITETVKVREEAKPIMQYGAAINTGALPTPSYRIVSKQQTREEIKKPGYIHPLTGFIRYLKDNHPDNWQEYLFGLFAGRSIVDKTVQRPGPKYPGDPTAIRKVNFISDEFANNEHDFDGRTPTQGRALWINMGLLVEIINYHSTQLPGMGDKPLFRVDIDDCVITGHPNMISADGEILLIPNALAPKYHSGRFGDLLSQQQDGNIKNEYFEKMEPADHYYPFIYDLPKENEISPPPLSYANYRLRKILSPLHTIKRDDISSVINRNRRKFAPTNSKKRFEFPFQSEYEDDSENPPRKYEAYYTGLLKNLYFNASAFKECVVNPDVKTYEQLFQKIFDQLNRACANFWDLSLVNATGRESTGEKLATMKVVDSKLTQYTSNGDQEIFTFDYNAADSLLQSINFRPMLSNAQAIRVLYAQSNQDTSKNISISGDNELLDYQFKDRLAVREVKRDEIKTKYFPDDSFRTTLGKLQAIIPSKSSVYQMTTSTFDEKGEIMQIIYRLAIPKENAELLSLMLDDNDKGHNPRYLGIMPGIQAEFTIQGIAGIRTFSMFRVRGLPEPYSEDNVVFRVINVTDTVQNGNWITNIIAGVIPLKAYFRSKLRLPTLTERSTNSLPTNGPTKF